MPIYNKLVRDGILTIIEQDGLRYHAKTLEQQEHLHHIQQKLLEEVQELSATTTPKEAVEELADILELIHAALARYETSFDELEAVRLTKKQQRGGFEQGIYLIDVEDS